MSMIEPYALFTRDATIQVFPASFVDAPGSSSVGEDDIDLERVVWDAEYRSEVKRRLGNPPRLP
ncbi:hypothetical protein SAMN06265365_103306 [Tistlia consotensis]|uniref:Uncharacterized protein n=1 Tax=Tistlia consotensis USBA 355 TaxID=560819 RepID=A0A1Y6C9N7_9PROT|nr:hypothetical protein [Tistlia consotensis]SMF43512.1 hypothetical protein SAMN05428998_11568 [Tistlia consotensis USBA 355]SNR42643.1 hypothetical protein SAMN06265365_103306 [Tistlia consotensis]